MWRTGKVLLMASMMVGSCQEPDPILEVEPTPTNRSFVGISRIIGPEGGRLTVGPVTLDVPPGALAHSLRVSIMPVLAGSPSDPADRRSPPVPAVPAGALPMRIEPSSADLRLPVKVSITTTAPLSQLAVSRAVPLGAAELVWQPLPEQGNSPGLLWAQSSQLGLFALAPVCDGADLGP